MQIDTNTQTRTITVQGMILNVPAPFVEGHTLAVNEAAVLNQTLAENLRNNFAKTAKKMETEKKELPEIQAAFDEYVVSYDFGVRRGASADPVEREALAIAKTRVKDALKSKGKTVKEVGGEEAVTELAHKVLDKYPEITEQAKAIVTQRNAAAADVLDLEDI